MDAWQQMGIISYYSRTVGRMYFIIMQKIKFEDILADKGPWHTFIWYGTLVVINLEIIYYVFSLQ